MSTFEEYAALPKRMRNCPQLSRESMHLGKLMFTVVGSGLKNDREFYPQYVRDLILTQWSSSDDPQPLGVLQSHTMWHPKVLGALIDTWGLKAYGVLRETMNPDLCLLFLNATNGDGIVKLEEPILSSAKVAEHVIMRWSHTHLCHLSETSRNNVKYIKAIGVISPDLARLHMGPRARKNKSLQAWIASEIITLAALDKKMGIEHDEPEPMERPDIIRLPEEASTDELEDWLVRTPALIIQLPITHPDYIYLCKVAVSSDPQVFPKIIKQSAVAANSRELALCAIKADPGTWRYCRKWNSDPTFATIMLGWSGVFLPTFKIEAVKTPQNLLILRTDVKWMEGSYSLGSLSDDVVLGCMLMRHDPSNYERLGKVSQARRDFTRMFIRGGKCPPRELLEIIPPSTLHHPEVALALVAALPSNYHHLPRSMRRRSAKVISYMLRHNPQMVDTKGKLWYENRSSLDRRPKPVDLPPVGFTQTHSYLRAHPQTFRHFDTYLRMDRQFIDCVSKQPGFSQNIRHIPNSRITSQHVLDAVRDDPTIRRNMGRELALVCIRETCGECVPHLASHFKADEELMAYACEFDPTLIKYAPPSIRNSIDVVMEFLSCLGEEPEDEEGGEDNDRVSQLLKAPARRAAIRAELKSELSPAERWEQHLVNIYKYAGNNVKLDGYIGDVCFARNINLFKWAPLSMRNNLETAYKFVQQDVNLFPHVSPRLKNRGWKLCQYAVKTDNTMIRYVGERYRFSLRRTWVASATRASKVAHKKMEPPRPYNVLRVGGWVHSASI